MIKVGIVGGTGYTGVELLRLLAGHPQVRLEIITSRSEQGKKVADMFPGLRGKIELDFSEPDMNALGKCDVVFFATPHCVAQEMMPAVLAKNVRAIDLSADFRIRDIAEWEKWYEEKHHCPDLVGQAVYGLPEFNREKIRNARLVACPGCYPTSVQLGFLPLIEAGIIDTKSLIANSASGVSGAGRQAKLDILYAEVNDSYKAYGISGHRHLPEIEQGLCDIGGLSRADLQLTFMPHLVPMSRGIHSTLYATLTNTDVDLQDIFEKRYHNEPFVDVLPEGVAPQTRFVKGSNGCQLSVIRTQHRDRVIVLSVIDNLTKGASGQAIQNMNIMFGLDETCGLHGAALVP